MTVKHIQHMHKSLDQMNLHLHHVISDVTGVTGAHYPRYCGGRTRSEGLSHVSRLSHKSAQDTMPKRWRGLPA